MRETYQNFVDRMIHRYEGGYGWDANDSGGPTNFGITCYDLAEHRHQKMTSMRAWAPLVRALKLQEAEDIYWQKYAVAIRYVDLPAGIDAVMMDYAVNSGISRAVRVANAIAGVSGPIMSVGSALMAYIKALDRNGIKSFIRRMNAERLAFLRRLGIWSTFGRGWTARVADLSVYSLRLVDGNTTTSIPVPTDLSKTAKGVVVPTNKTKQVAGAAIGAPASGIALHAAGLPMWLVGVVMVVLVGAAVIWGLYEAHKDLVANDVHLPTGV